MFMSSDFHNDLSLCLITLIKFKAISILQLGLVTDEFPLQSYFDLDFGLSTFTYPETTIK